MGFNILKQGLITQEDKLAIKIAYFDTKIRDFIHMGLGLTPPGVGMYSMSSAAFVNNLEITRFRGVEYQINYDLGKVYTELGYTHMIGKNKFCHPEQWLGGHLKPIWDGKGWRFTVRGHKPDPNALTVCSNMGSSEHMPMDRGNLTLGTRLFDQQLDMGIRVRTSEGFSVKPSELEKSKKEYIYSPDWKRYTVYDFYSSYKVTDNLLVRFSIENFTDRAYMVPMGDVLSLL